jgi:hypothetical protein
MPSSGDCEVTVERPLLETEMRQFDCEMAAPVIMKDANRHRSQPLQPECEWKQGDCGGGKYREEPESASRWSAMGSLDSRSKKTFPRRKVNGGGSRLPLVGDQPYRRHDQMNA